MAKSKDTKKELDKQQKLSDIKVETFDFDGKLLNKKTIKSKITKGNKYEN